MKTKTLAEIIDDESWGEDKSGIGLSCGATCSNAPTVEQLRDLISSWRNTGRSLNQNETKIALGTGLFHCAEELEKLLGI